MVRASRAAGGASVSASESAGEDVAVHDVQRSYVGSLTPATAVYTNESPRDDVVCVASECHEACTFRVRERRESCSLPQATLSLTRRRTQPRTTWAPFSTASSRVNARPEGDGDCVTTPTARLPDTNWATPSQYVRSGDSATDTTVQPPDTNWATPSPADSLGACGTSLIPRARSRGRLRRPHEARATAADG